VIAGPRAEALAFVEFIKKNASKTSKAMMTTTISIQGRWRDAATCGLYFASVVAVPQR
jgi:hypothetical protein